MSGANPVLQVSDLAVEFQTEMGTVRAIDQVGFDLSAGETLGLVGESGCGKSVTSLAIMGLIPHPQGRIASGSIRLDGQELVGLPEKALRQKRGRDISMIFQEPMTALNPVLSIATQMTDVLRRHQGMSRQAARNRAVDMLDQVDIPSPHKRIDDYPHELSGGMRQRVMIAMALSCNPKVLIADEPTTALDVTTQAQVLDEILRLQEAFGTAVILITHDLGVIAETCQRAIVMYCGKMVEVAQVDDLFERPWHPYTAGLMASVPRIRKNRLPRLPTIPGTVPDLLHLPSGCRFVDRCPRAQTQCQEIEPGLYGQPGQHRHACHFPLPEGPS